MYLSCKDIFDEKIVDNFECCGSCHSDEDEGYTTLGEYELPNGDIIEGVCCGSRHALNKKFEDKLKDI